MTLRKFAAQNDWAQQKWMCILALEPEQVGREMS